MTQEWFEEHNNDFEVLTWPPKSPDSNQIEHLWDVLDKSLIHWGVTLQFTGFKGSATDGLVPESTVYMQRWNSCLNGSGWFKERPTR